MICPRLAGEWLRNPVIVEWMEKQTFAMFSPASLPSCSKESCPWWDKKTQRCLSVSIDGALWELINLLAELLSSLDLGEAEFPTEGGGG